MLSHDFADGFNTYTITSLYGNDRRRALTLLVADALAPVTGAAITLLVTIPQEILGLYLGFLAGVLLYLHPPTSFLSTFVMVRQNHADEKRTDIHERYSFSTSASIAPSVPPPRHSPHG